MTVNRTVIAFLVFTLILASAGCTRAPQAEPAPEPSATPAPAPVITIEPEPEPEPIYPLTIVDDLGRTVIINARPERIVSLAPSNTEILAALGALERVAGVTDSCNYPPEVADKQRLGQLYDVKHTNFETILALEPDLALAIGGHPEVVSRLEELGITVIAFDPGTVAAAVETIERIGRAIDAVEEAEQLVGELRARLDRISAIIPSDRADRPLALFEIWPEPLMVAGPSSFVADILETAGAINLAADAVDPYPMLSREIVIERDPEYVITTFPQTVEDVRAGLREDLAGTRAAIAGQIIVLDQDISSRPGPRIVDAVEAVARALYPGRLP